MMGLQAGAARVNITPPVGIAQGGFAARQEGCKGIHDDLYAKALALDDGEHRAAIITCDLLGMDMAFVGEIRGILEQKAGVPADHVAVCCSHTHSGPLWCAPGFWERTEDQGIEEEWGRVLPRMIAGAGRMAFDRLEEARVGAGVGTVRIGVNRRHRNEQGKMVIAPNPEGPVDTQVGVVRVDRMDGTPLALLVNYACHGVVLGADNLLISADYAGAMMRMVEGAVGKGVTVLFANGACGNINPRFRGTFEAMERTGWMLGGEVLKVMQEIGTSSDVRLNMLHRRIYLPIKTFPPLEEAERTLAEKERLLRQAEAGDLSENMTGLRGKIMYSRHVVSMLRALSSSQRKKDLAQGRIASEIQGLTMGDTALLMLPGELFVEIALAIRERSPFCRTLICGYANDYAVSYVPTAAAYEEGGYEPTWTKVAPGADQVMIEESLSVLKDLCTT